MRRDKSSENLCCVVLCENPDTYYILRTVLFDTGDLAFCTLLPISYKPSGFL